MLRKLAQILRTPCYVAQADDVTSSGVIVGMNCAGTGFLHAVEWTTVPPRWSASVW
jgi:hypothetical protein